MKVINRYKKKGKANKRSKEREDGKEREGKEMTKGGRREWEEADGTIRRER